jgi:leucyl aminopeptidase
MIALGEETAGLFSNDKNFVKEIEAASEESFEAVWHLPITEEHKESIKG